MTTPERAELLRLLAALCDMRLTDGEHARLESLLSADREARRLYLQYVDVHSRLVMHPGLAKSRKMPPKEAWAWAALEEAVGMERDAAAWNARRRRAWTWQRIATYVGVAAATLAASLLVQITLREPPPAKYTVLPVSAYAEPPPYVGTLTQTVKARWDEGHAGLTDGVRLLPGPVRLEEGLARIRFDSGVELIVEGPAEMRLESIKSAAVVEGKVVFRGESTSVPFTIHTPSSILIDTGTEYGIDVKAKGEEVHVFEGEVQREAVGAKPGQVPEVLPAGEARSYVTDWSVPGKKESLDRDRFKRNLPDAAPTPPDPLQGLLAYEGFDYQQPTDLKDGKGTGGSGWDGKWEFIVANPITPQGVPRWTLNVNQGLSLDAQGLSSGGSYDYAGSGRYRRRLATPIELNTDAAYFVSYLFRREAPPRDSRYRKGPHPFPSDSSRVAIHLRADAYLQHDPCKRVSIGIEHNNLLLAKLEMGAGMPKQLPLSYKQSYLLVAKILASSTQADQLFVRIYGSEEPVDLEEPVTWTDQGPTVHSTLTFDWLEIEINSLRRQTLDELRVGNTWASVTAPYIVAPPPAQQQPSP